MHTIRATIRATRGRNDAWGVALSNVDVIAKANPLTLFLVQPVSYPATWSLDSRMW
jgi:hypothetical protein